LSDQTDTTGRYLVISSDTHAGPPAERYRDYLDPKYRDAFDEDLRLVKEMSRARSDLTQAGDFEAKWLAETGDGGRRASWDPSARDAELDKEGVVAEVIFPDADVLGGAASAPFHAGLGSAGDLDGELVMAGAVAHNRWLEDLCSSSPERRCGVATVPILHDIPAAVREIERLAAAGFRAVMIPTVWVDKPSYNDLRYEPVWSACENHAMVVHIHSGGASRDLAVEAPGLIAIYATEAWWWAARPLWVMLWGGVFERHPKLRFAITEDGAWWIPGIVQRMDEKFVGFHNTEKMGNAFRQTISQKPSEFFGTNIFVGASTPSREEVEQRHKIGVDAFMWGNDFPHPEGTWPHTRQSITESFCDVPTGEAERMLGLNAAAVYGFDVKRLSHLAAEIGPSHRDVHGSALVATS
jgi:predicted TIM-barrel fold metal-dependent hydrolase